MQFVIFNPWKVPWNWITFYQNYFVIPLGFLYHLIRRDSGRLANEAFTSNPIVSSKQRLNGLKITNSITTLRFFQGFFWNILHEPRFLVKLWAVHYRVTGQKFNKTLIDRRLFFLKLFFLRQLTLGPYSGENLWLSLLVVKLLSSHCSLATLLK